MTTISVTDNMPLFGALGMWATGRYALAPREDYFPPDKTVEEVNEQDAQAFRDSQSAAEIAALRYLGLPGGGLRRRRSRTDSPSAGVLEPQDQIVEVDGTPVTDFAVAAGRARRHDRPGQVVAVTVLRDGERRTSRRSPSAPTRRSAARASSASAPSSDRSRRSPSSIALAATSAARRPD